MHSLPSCCSSVGHHRPLPSGAGRYHRVPQLHPPRWLHPRPRGVVSDDRRTAFRRRRTGIHFGGAGCQTHLHGRLCLSSWRRTRNIFGHCGSVIDSSSAELRRFSRSGNDVGTRGRVGASSCRHCAGGRNMRRCSLLGGKKRQTSFRWNRIGDDESRYNNYQNNTCITVKVGGDGHVAYLELWFRGPQKSRPRDNWACAVAMWTEGWLIYQ